MLYRRSRQAGCLSYWMVPVKIGKETMRFKTFATAAIRRLDMND